MCFSPKHVCYYVFFKTKNITFVDKIKFHTSIMKDQVTAVTICGWVSSSPKPRKKIYAPFCGQYNVKSIKLPGVANPNICGRAIPSNKSPLVTNFELPGNSKFKHMMCLCADHHYLFHELFVKLYLAKDRKPLPFKPK